MSHSRAMPVALTRVAYESATLSDDHGNREIVLVVFLTGGHCIRGGVGQRLGACAANA